MKSGVSADVAAGRHVKSIEIDTRCNGKSRDAWRAPRERAIRLWPSQRYSQYAYASPFKYYPQKDCFKNYVLPWRNKPALAHQ